MTTEILAATTRQTELPAARRVLAVVAHPDDETFGLGGLLGTYADAGADVAVLCFTRGEASTLGVGRQDLSEQRSREFHRAARTLGVRQAWLRAYPDGHLVDEPLAVLGDEVRQVAAAFGPELLLAFHPAGITGHPDHVRATEAARHAAAHAGLPVLAWHVPATVAATLNTTFDAEFAIVDPVPGDLAVPVDRARQRAAFACHDSQHGDLPVVERMIELLGEAEHLRPLNTVSSTAPDDARPSTAQGAIR